jgi:hypothetical protein
MSELISKAIEGLQEENQTFSSNLLGSVNKLEVDCERIFDLLMGLYPYKCEYVKNSQKYVEYVNILETYYYRFLLRYVNTCVLLNRGYLYRRFCSCYSHINYLKYELANIPVRKLILDYDRFVLIFNILYSDDIYTTSQLFKVYNFETELGQPRPPLTLRFYPKYLKPIIPSSSSSNHTTTTTTTTTTITIGDGKSSSSPTRVPFPTAKLTQSTIDLVDNILMGEVDDDDLRGSKSIRERIVYYMKENVHYQWFFRYIKSCADESGAVNEKFESIISHLPSASPLVSSPSLQPPRMVTIPQPLPLSSSPAPEDVFERRNEPIYIELNRNNTEIRCELQHIDPTEFKTVVENAMNNIVAIYYNLLQLPGKTRVLWDVPKVGHLAAESEYVALLVKVASSSKTFADEIEKDAAYDFIQYVGFISRWLRFCIIVK